jgi:methionine synthase I (cobalamin-dependent)/5,10-methylenetetrahydrofolate reductase
MRKKQSAIRDPRSAIDTPPSATRQSQSAIRNSQFLSRLASSPIPLLSDGAMGTMLNLRGASFDQCFDILNLTQPDLVAEVHRAYLEAGSDILQTNTFGANRYKLAAHGLEDKVTKINHLGVKLARQIGVTGRSPVLVAGDVGPLGVRLAPFGRVQPHEARTAFREQITALVEAGVDLIIIETFTDLYEIREAILAAREVGAAHASPVPVVASMTFTRDDRTLLGDSPAKVARALVEAGAEVIGINCSGGPAQIYRILRQMRQAISGEDGVRPYFSVMPNAGWPEQVGGRIMYPANPDYFGEYARAFCEAGASIIGGCCGTTPQHIASMRRAIDRPQGCRPDILQISEVTEALEISQAANVPSRFAQILAAGKFVISVEMDPPRGLSTHKLVAGANLLTEAGADVINIADSPMARMRMSPWAVCSVIQREFNIETVLHFPTRGRNLLRVQGDLLAAHALGVRNVFVVMGDPTSIGDYPDAMDNYDLVPSGLIKLIKQSFNIGLDHAGADIGQPTSFFVGCAFNLSPRDPDDEVKNLQRKIKAGADFILTQPVYQPEAAEKILRLYEEKHGLLETPVLVGIMPLYSVRHATFLNNEVPGMTIPEAMFQRLRAAGEATPKEGVRIALELIEQIRPWARGVYLMPQFSRYDLAAEIIEGCKTQ